MKCALAVEQGVLREREWKEEKERDREGEEEMLRWRERKIWGLVLLRPGNPYCRGIVSTVDLLVLTRLDQLLVTLKFNCSFYETTYLN
jgi:hypothetical protein